MGSVQVPPKPVLQKFLLTDKTVVVTGGGRGLGLGFARSLAEVGANVAAIDIHGEPDEEFEELSAFNVKAVYHKCDVRDHERLRETINLVAKQFGSIDGCITAAGIMTNKPFMEHTPQDLSDSYAVNLIGTFSAAQICAEHMIKQKTGGNIICISSTAGHRGLAPQTATAYVCSKHAVIGLVKQAAGELAKHNIRMNSISPGPFLTKMLRSVMEKDPTQEERFAKSNILNRMALPEELGGAIVYLMSDASSFVTGNDFNIDGGSGCQ